MVCQGRDVSLLSREELEAEVRDCANGTQRSMDAARQNAVFESAWISR